ncbi:hypothetical protein J1605_020246 [Eschrichtius robustus]|uniref:Uncharacterized protein n=1 Tax=Eschrichtius robustus TaxID=9764 RepID=A0AB34HGP1_ESCRO|nr:hypothetical protein J1605_020246 [Eschrichtius robustus]
MMAIILPNGVPAYLSNIISDTSTPQTPLPFNHIGKARVTEHAPHSAPLFLGSPSFFSLT